MERKISSRNFIDAHKVHDDVFITGMFYSGITIYNQQIRTLNLIYFLIEKGEIRSARETLNPIVILGAGVAGLTAAMALKKLKYKVILLEEKSLLLHLQHGCMTRQIHPNLYLWPREDSLKPFTELPFGNWVASTAGEVEKTLIREYELLKGGAGGTLREYYNVSECKVDLRKRSISFETSKKAKNINYSTLILATGFGLEKFVGRKERTKSYWRNEDVSQLRLSDQISKFFISGTGDGGISDVCRLTLIAFDPYEWAKHFSDVAKFPGLLEDLRQVEFDNRQLANINYSTNFKTIFDKHKDALTALFEKYRRTDVEKPVLNGSKNKFSEILVKGKMSFINAWLVFNLHQLDFIEYEGGEFPGQCGKYLLTEDDKDEHHLIVRHGTDRNWDRFKALNEKFEKKAKHLQNLQEQKKYNDFSTGIHWELDFWFRRAYTRKKYIVSPKLEEICSFFLVTLNGILSNFISSTAGSNISYRLTLHRLVVVSGETFFQQVAPYVGTKEGERTDVGRAFPIKQGIVGLSMRTNTCFSLVRQRGNNQSLLFTYNKIVGLPLIRSV